MNADLSHQHEGPDDNGSVTDSDEWVRCQSSGEWIRKRMAMRVRLGTGQAVWVRADWFRDG